MGRKRADDPERELPRWLALAGPAGEPAYAERLAWFRRFLLLHVATRTFLTAPGPVLGELAPILQWTTIAVALLGLAAPRLTLACTRVACPLVLAYVPSYFPDNANHVFLEFLLLAFLSLLDEGDEREGPLLLAALRWIVAVVFAWTGVQKVLYGYYFDGQFLAYMAATKTWFADALRHLMPSGELERLLALNEAQVDAHNWRPRIGAGPYRVDSALFVAVSNAVYVFEIAAGVLLVLPRSRVAAALASMLFVVFIELGARELTFGVMMVNAFLLYLPGNQVRRTFVLWALAYAYLALAKHGVVPMFPYSSA